MILHALLRAYHISGVVIVPMKKLFSLFISAAVLLAALIVPQLSTAAAEFPIDFGVYCTSLYLENLDTETVVYTKNADQRRYPASTTKIMTYIITAENVKDLKNTMVTIKSSVLHMLDGTGSSMAGLKADEKLSVYQLLHCLMIPSGNDAALVLADYIGKGDIKKFVEMMNKKAEELGCEDTHFVNPHGLNDPDHYTTASDMAKIAKYACSLPEFLEITDKATSDIIGEDRYLVTTNSMIDPVRGGNLYYPYAQGIKTGSTGNDSGYCLVSTATKNKYTYLCVAFGAPYEDEEGELFDNGAMLDSIHLYDWAFDNLSIKTVLDRKDLAKEIKLEFAWNKDTIQLSPAKSYSTILPDDVDISSIEKTYRVPEKIEAPVKDGDVIGKVELSYNGQLLTTVDLIATENIDRSELLSALDSLWNVLSSQIFIIILIIIAVLAGIYAIVFFVYRRKKRAQRPVKKYRKF